jgi:hypothetical protein
LADPFSANCGSDAQLQRDLRLAGAAVATEKRNRQVRDHIVHKPTASRNRLAGKIRPREPIQVRDRRLGVARCSHAVIFFACRRRRMGAVHREPWTSFCPFLPIALLAELSGGAR